MDERLFQQLIEVNYLTTENAWRYRTILRFFYIQHERLRHYLFPEEVYKFLKQSPHFYKYTLEQLQQDLNQLVEWKNLIPRQDMGRVTTIEEFKRKKFRYQCTPYTVEIERMVVSLEEKGDSFGGSLERTLFDRLLSSLMKITSKESVHKLSPENLFSLWEEMYDNFRKLAENATDYLAHLESEKVEEIMMTEAFVVYKDSLTKYLRNFMTSLQRTAFRIESLLSEVEEDFIEEVAEKLAVYYQSIPRLEDKVEKETVIEKYLNQWQSISAWFLGQERQESDMAYLQKATNETIRRMTRFAQRLGEKHHSFKSRRKDYLHLAKWFNSCSDIKEAHLLSSCVFGAFHTRHLYADTKTTEDIYAEVWDEHPTKMTLKPRIRNYREKTRPSAIISRQREKEKTMEKFIREREAEQKLIEQVVKNDRIILRELSSKDPYIRKTLLYWISKCMGSKDLSAKTDVFVK
ncbi:MAG: TIGR02677 family protein [Clostridia bacterium]|nr:TIGR02677 family protein [Clostridia bacterium]